MTDIRDDIEEIIERHGALTVQEMRKRMGYKYGVREMVQALIYTDEFVEVEQVPVDYGKRHLAVWGMEDVTKRQRRMKK